MARNQIVVASDATDQGVLSISFKKEDFSEFVFSLLSTPREERKKILGGFDLLKSDIKLIVDKLNHQIRTQNDVVSFEVGFDTVFESGVELSQGSYEHFFNIDEPRRESIESVSVTISYLIGFNREPSKKSYEKQIVNLHFRAGKVGSFEINIRSTDITWPNSIFLLLEREFSALCEQSAPGQRKFRRAWYNKIASLVADDNEVDDANVSRLSKQIVPLALIASLSTAIAAGFTSSIGRKIPYFISDDGVTLVVVNLEEVIAKFGLELAAQKLFNAQTLLAAGFQAEEADRISTALAYVGEYAVPFVIGVLLFSTLAFANYRLGFSVRLARVGRIFLTGVMAPPRKKVDLSLGVLPSLLIGIIASTIATYLWVGLVQ